MIKYVNCLMGTRSSKRFSEGNTLPLVQLPFGFASFSPVTDSNRGSWFYHPDDKCFEGFRLTHQPSPWIKDHGAIEFLPQTGKPELSGNMRRSGFSDYEITPSHVKYHLTRHMAEFSLAPTVYGGVIKVEFMDESEHYLSFLPVSGRYWFRWEESKSTLYVKTDCMECDGAGGDGFFAYFAIEFEDGIVCGDEILLQKGSDKKKGTFVFGEDCGIHLKIIPKSFECRMATSFISHNQAEKNLEYEASLCSFDLAKENAEELWNCYLDRIEVSGDEAFLTKFYSCMYRCFLFPHRAHEPNGNRKFIHYSPIDDSVKNGVRYTDCGFWDTYRTTFPLFAIIAKDEYREFVQGFLNDYEECGWLPRWTSGNYKNCMPSTMFDAVIAHGAKTGVLPKEMLEKLLPAMIKQTQTVSFHPAFGRAGCLEYNSLGYVPRDRYGESVNLTLDAAYCDWCIAIVAQSLEKHDTAERFFERSKSYRNIFDKERGYMVGRNSDGSFATSFSPYAWGGDYTEANAIQTTFSVPHDLIGLADLFGGEEELINRLDELFFDSSRFEVGGYGTEIHEMTEAAAEGFGQCAICNQPSFHLPFLYAYFGKPEKTEYWVNKICNEGFGTSKFPGDEDNGSMAAWFVFAALGMYPVCPGSGELVKFKGIADSIKTKVDKK